MAGVQLHEDGLQQAVDRELDSIINDLTFGVDNAHTRLVILIQLLDALRARALKELQPDERFLSTDELCFIVNKLEDSVSQFRQAQEEMLPLLKFAELSARRSLSMTAFNNDPEEAFENLNSVRLQQLMDAGRQSNLWMRMAHRRAGSVMPPEQAGLAHHAETATNLLRGPVLHWAYAPQYFTELLREAIESFLEALNMLSTVFHRTSVRSAVLQKVQSILGDAQEVALYFTIAEDIQGVFNTLDNLSTSAAAEVNYIDEYP